MWTFEIGIKEEIVVTLTLALLHVAISLASLRRLCGESDVVTLQMESISVSCVENK